MTDNLKTRRAIARLEDYLIDKGMEGSFADKVEAVRAISNEITPRDALELVREMLRPHDGEQSGVGDAFKIIDAACTQ